MIDPHDIWLLHLTGLMFGWMIKTKFSFVWNPSSGKTDGNAVIVWNQVL